MPTRGARRLRAPSNSLNYVQQVYAAVFDGHGGNATADWLSNNLLTCECQAAGLPVWPSLSFLGDRSGGSVGGPGGRGPSHPIPPALSPLCTVGAAVQKAHAAALLMFLPPPANVDVEKFWQGNSAPEMAISEAFIKADAVRAALRCAVLRCGRALVARCAAAGPRVQDVLRCGAPPGKRGPHRGTRGEGGRRRRPALGTARTHLPPRVASATPTCLQPLIPTLAAPPVSHCRKSCRQREASWAWWGSAASAAASAAPPPLWRSFTSTRCGACAPVIDQYTDDRSVTQLSISWLQRPAGRLLAFALHSRRLPLCPNTLGAYLAPACPAWPPAYACPPSPFSPAPGQEQAAHSQRG